MLIRPVDHLLVLWFMLVGVTNNVETDGAGGFTMIIEVAE